jgi:hypothetical protein
MIYTTGSFNDWFLPSHDELYEMFLHRDSIGGFQAALYWSSTDDTASNAWAMEAESVLSGHSDVGRVKQRFLVKYDIQDERTFVAWAGCIRNDRVTRGLSFVSSALVKPDLSSLDELQEMYAQRDVLIGLQDAFVWSSTEIDSDNVHTVNLTSGQNPPTDKLDFNSVRPIRAF